MRGPALAVSNPDYGSCHDKILSIELNDHHKLGARLQIAIFRSMFLGYSNINFLAPVRAYELVQSFLFTTAPLKTEESGYCGGEMAVMGR